MSIDSVVDIIVTLDTLRNHEELNSFTEEYIEDGDSSVINVNFIEDDDLRENVDEIELSAGHFFLNDDGSINKYNHDKIKKFGYTVEKLPSNDEGFTHYIGCDMFKIYFSNY